MSVFISWSGTDSKSHKVAQLLRDWLPKVIQKLNCFLSSHDIDPGSVWCDSLFRSLESSRVGILCLTAESAQRPWLLFEAGVIAKSLTQQRVYPLLLELAPSDLPQPLAVFQGGAATKPDMLKLVKMVNESAGDAALETVVLLESFETRWPVFEKEVSEILKAKHAVPAAKAPEAPWQTAVQETLTLVRGIAAGNIPVSAKVPVFEARAERVDVSKRENSPLHQTHDSVFPSRNEAGREMHRRILEKVEENRPLLVHWVSMSVAAGLNAMPLSYNYCTFCLYG